MYKKRSLDIMKRPVFYVTMFYIKTVNIKTPPSKTSLIHIH